MNYPFIIDQQIPNQPLNMLKTIILLVSAFAIFSAQAQQGLVTHTQRFVDKNGTQQIKVVVQGACNPNDDLPDDGKPTSIKATISNGAKKQHMFYNEPDYQMLSIYFTKKDIWTKVIDSSTLVFIPFYYCSNMDSEVTLSFFVFYNNQKALHHVVYKCAEEEKGSCVLKSKKWDQKLNLPLNAKKALLSFISKKYKLRSDF